MPEHVIIQSAGSAAVAVFSALMMMLQTVFFIKKPMFRWFAWGAAVSLSSLVYSLGVFIEYNSPLGPLNRIAGLVEFTAIIVSIHCLYGFSFSFLEIPSQRYHLVAGTWHALILVMLWCSRAVVSDQFVQHRFLGMSSPYVEPALGPLGALFVLYAAAAGLAVIVLWYHRETANPQYRRAFLIGVGVWIALGCHDGLVVYRLSTIQYVMEYGFLGFALAVLWVVFGSYLEAETEEKYRVITELATECILVFQDGRVVFENAACGEMLGVAATGKRVRDLLRAIDTDDRKTAYAFYRSIQSGAESRRLPTFRIAEPGGGVRHVETAARIIQFKGRPAILAVARDCTARNQAEAQRNALISELQEALAQVKSLSGLLPICASCKKIRDDQGYWSRIEAYIEAHSEAAFTHSICPECKRKLYPELSEP